ncbi:MAG: Spermidine/putrescine import ATP-binding protein PotA [Rhodocyclaceae bacterium]|jgi:iron(III) transport system ATP-binding protein|nr:Spermidine/putrescine import ATP-binding protein PotA [Rhodocyclaceae bacterium]
MPLLEIKHISHSYGRQAVVRDLSCALDQGAIGCLLGPSGCGKTTVLRAIAGFEPVQSGEIRIGGATVSSPSAHVPPEQRRIGMVFQDYALFPHLSVADNVAFGLQKSVAAARRARVDELLATVGLAGAAAKYPHELSGGQQQRVALARALAPKPDLLLLDEPFSNLDVDLRERLSLEVRDILKQSGITAILVTHDQHEAFAVADEIGIMHEGCIQQWDTPYNLYHRPANRFVADFVGQGVFMRGEVLNAREVEIELGRLAGRIPTDCSAGCQACGKNCRVDVLLRPDDIVHDDAAATQAEVVAKAFRGAEFLYTLQLPSGQRVLSLVPSHHNHAIGEKIGIRLDVDHVVVFRNA